MQQQPQQQQISQQLLQQSIPQGLLHQNAVAPVELQQAPLPHSIPSQVQVHIKLLDVVDNRHYYDFFLLFELEK